jgi:hypothetical protein
MRITTTTIFLMLTVLVLGQTPRLICNIKTDKYIYKKGTVPTITVEIKNNTDSAIYLVKSLDGSSSQMRFPYAYFEIQKLSDTSYRQDKSRYCGNYDEIDTSDFVEVTPDATFDPSISQSRFYTDYSMKNIKNFEKKGKYKIIYHYSTNETRFIKWMGDPYAGQARRWFDEKTGKIKSEHEREYNRLLELFKLVPKTELVSNELIIEVK